MTLIKEYRWGSMEWVGQLRGKGISALLEKISTLPLFLVSLPRVQGRGEYRGEEKRPGAGVIKKKNRSQFTICQLSSRGGRRAHPPAA